MTFINLCDRLARSRRRRCVRLTRIATRWRRKNYTERTTTLLVAAVAYSFASTDWCPHRKKLNNNNHHSAVNAYSKHTHTHTHLLFVLHLNNIYCIQHVVSFESIRINKKVFRSISTKYKMCIMNFSSWQFNPWYFQF